jgi:hypothetical protein
MGRFGDPEDLLGTVLWLLSPASSFVTGAVIPIDGGFAARRGLTFRSSPVDADMKSICVICVSSSAQNTGSVLTGWFPDKKEHWQNRCYFCRRKTCRRVLETKPAFFEVSENIEVVRMLKLTPVKAYLEQIASIAPRSKAHLHPVAPPFRSLQVSILSRSIFCIEFASMKLSMVDTVTSAA